MMHTGILENVDTRRLLQSKVVVAVEKAGVELRRQKRTQTCLFWLGFFLMIGLSIFNGEFYPKDVIQVFPRFFNYINKTLPALHWNTLLEDVAHWYWNSGYWLKLLFNTALMGAYGTFLGTVAAFITSFFASRNLVNSHLVYFLSRRILELSRTVPELVFALIFVWAFGLGPMAGVLAIAVHTFGTLGKLFSEINENCDMEQVKGLRATGANWIQTMRFAILPQVLPNFTSYTLHRFEINVRAASVLGLVGAGGIGGELYYVIKQFFYRDISAITLMMIITVVIIDTVSERLRHRLIGTMDSRKV
jgi:phosphonate transport system permease protein